jgi:alkylated DNA repair dioxygenase AlkB
LIEFLFIIKKDRYMEKYGSGDTYIIKNLFTNPDEIFYRLKNEVPFGHMYNQGSLVPRLICVERDTLDSGYKPLYRHPYDGAPPETNWTPTVKLVKERLASDINQKNNHCLIQMYQGGKSFIGKHTDKTLDIIPNTAIINVSFGAVRIMVLQNKRTKKKQKIMMEHNSALIFGLDTNREWTHSIKQDNRQNNLKTEGELAFNSERISMTFRSVGTFVNSSGHIIGQGARTDKEIRDEIVEKKLMLDSFGRENWDPDFDRKEYYDKGFNVIDFNGL